MTKFYINTLGGLDGLQDISGGAGEDNIPEGHIVNFQHVFVHNIGGFVDIYVLFIIGVLLWSYFSLQIIKNKMLSSSYVSPLTVLQSGMVYSKLWAGFFQN